MKQRILAAATALALMPAFSMAEPSAAPESPAKPKFAEKEYDLDTGEVSFTFGNGKSLALNVNELAPEIQKQLMLHGAAQKIGDSYAGAKGNFAEALEAAGGVIEQLKQGIWRAARGEGDARPRLAELAEAISRIKQVELEKATAAVEKATDEQRKTWRSNAKVKAVIAQIRAEKAAKALEEAGETQLEVEIA